MCLIGFIIMWGYGFLPEFLFPNEKKYNSDDNNCQDDFDILIE